ncbi:MAG TPA: ABC transporter permease [Acidimicrobiales bacterium]|nr:ABC transporter permease [Acidimicrobiales bacterium]
MSDLSLALAQTAYALRGFLRNARALIFTVIMPVFLLLLFNAIFHGTLRFEGHPAPASSYFTASIVSYQIMLAGFGSLLISVTTARQAGLLKRFRGTPMPGWVYLASEIGLSIAVVATTVTVLVAVGVIFDHVALSGHLLVGLVVYLVVGTASFCALGLALARVCTTTDTASAIGPFSTVVLSFLSGVFVPISIMPAWLLDLGNAFPLAHLARGMQAAFLVPGSTGISAEHLGVLAAWGMGGLVAAVRSFRWEPLGAGAS